jgi:putative phosphoribosyl transferase
LESTLFANRVDAGRQLAEKIAQAGALRDAVVLGIPRGGVVVAAEVARGLGLPLDVVVAAKVGAPSNPEYAIGAVAADGEVYANPASGFSAAEVRGFSGSALDKVRHSLATFRRGLPALALEGRTALIVDDGLATGLTALAAVGYARRAGASRIVLAVPVAPPDTVRALEPHADAIVVLETPAGFSAVGQFYRDFGQTEDAEVSALLAEAAQRTLEP